jgi:hypothetical protein
VRLVTGQTVSRQTIVQHLVGNRPFRQHPAAGPNPEWWPAAPGFDCPGLAG